MLTGHKTTAFLLNGPTPQPLRDSPSRARSHCNQIISPKSTSFHHNFRKSSAHPFRRRREPKLSAPSGSTSSRTDSKSQTRQSTPRPTLQPCPGIGNHRPPVGRARLEYAQRPSGCRAIPDCNSRLGARSTRHRALSWPPLPGRDQGRQGLSFRFLVAYRAI